MAGAVEAGARRRILIDCDPGIDDAIALLLALASPEEIELVAVTCVAGNVPLAATARNARRVLTLAGRHDIPVAAGAERPIMAAVGVSAMAHGGDGLGDVEMPEPGFPLAAEHAVDLLVDAALAAAPGSLTLCPIGPLTNVALALLKAPAIVDRFAEVAIMGGACFRPGNVTPTAEFNFHFDPHAAQIVLSSGLPIVLFPLDVTLRALATPARLEAIGAGGAVAERAAAMLEAYGARALHDACTVAYLLRPALFSGVAAHIEAVTAPGPCFGQSVASVGARHLAGRAPNARAMTEVDADGFFGLVAERLARL